MLTGGLYQPCCPHHRIGWRKEAEMTFTVGIISDTHGLLRPEALRVLAPADHIIHGGDIGDPEIIPALRRIAPVTAIKGNVDTGAWSTRFAETEFVTLGGRRFYVLHDLKTLSIDPVANGIDVIISGHSHCAKDQRRGRLALCQSRQCRTPALQSADHPCNP
jgi:uncharacterized protein